MNPSAQDPEKQRVPAAVGVDKPSFGLPKWRRYTILFVVSLLTLVITYSSTCFLTAMPEISADFSTTSEKIAATNAGVLLAMGFSSFIWNPAARIVGRKWAYNAAVLTLCLCSIGIALSINMAMFTAMRILAGLTGTYFMVAGQAILSDIFPPVCSLNSPSFFFVSSLVSQLEY